MSAGYPYLQKQRKSELTDIAVSVGLKDYEQLKKSDLETALDEHLRVNQTTFSGKPELQEYYKRFTSRTSPIKQAAGEEKKARARRQTIKPPEDAPRSDSEPTASGSSTSLIPRTPLSNLQLSRRVRNLPPSPAAITDAIDAQTTKIRTSLTKAWTSSGVTETVESTRETLSSVQTIELLILVLELYYLRPEILPLRYAFTIPAVAAVGTSAYPVMLPDLFLLVSGAFWAPFSLWLLTSVLGPLFFAYFFNLSLKAKGTRANPAVPFKFDPLIYNISKAILTFLTYARHYRFYDTYTHFTIERVATNLPGGWPGVLAGAAVGSIGSVYEAVLRK